MRQLRQFLKPLKLADGCESNPLFDRLYFADDSILYALICEECANILTPFFNAPFLEHDRDEEIVRCSVRNCANLAKYYFDLIFVQIERGEDIIITGASK